MLRRFRLVETDDTILRMLPIRPSTCTYNVTQHAVFQDISRQAPSQTWLNPVHTSARLSGVSPPPWLGDHFTKSRSLRARRPFSLLCVFVLARPRSSGTPSSRRSMANRRYYVICKAVSDTSQLSARLASIRALSLWPTECTMGSSGVSTTSSP